MDAARLAFHNQRFAAAIRLARMAFFHHDIRDSKDGPFCGRCGISLDSPTTMLSLCKFVPSCERCGNMGVVKVAVFYRPLPTGEYLPIESRLPCPDCFEFTRGIEEEYWDVVGETRRELAQKSPPKHVVLHPNDGTGVA